MSVTDRFSVNGVSRHDGEKECNHPGCHQEAAYDIELIDRHGCNGLVRSCEDHGGAMYGYDPEEDLD